MHLTLGSMLGHSDLVLLLVGVGSLFWVINYILVIIKGFKDESYGIPWPAVCFNLTWEVLFAFHFPVPPIETWIARAWLGLDIVILYLVLRYGRALDPNPVRRHFFYAKIAIMLTSAMALQYTFIVSFNDFRGGISAFMINLVMAVLFVSLRWQRPDNRGLTIAGAWLMTAGTALTAIGALVRGGLPGATAQMHGFLHIVYLLTFAFNCIYLYVLVGPWAARERRLETAS